MQCSVVKGYTSPACIHSEHKIYPYINYLFTSVFTSLQTAPDDVYFFEIKLLCVAKLIILEHIEHKINGQNPSPVICVPLYSLIICIKNTEAVIFSTQKGISIVS